MLTAGAITAGSASLPSDSQPCRPCPPRPSSWFTALESAAPRSAKGASSACPVNLAPRSAEHVVSKAQSEEHKTAAGRMAESLVGST
jgi:hypothetical protein